MVSVFKPTMILIIGRSLGMAAGFLVPVVLARTFNQHEFGTYKQLFLIYGTLFGIVQIGMSESLYYFLPRSREQAGRYVLNSVAVLTGMGLLSMAVLLAAGPVFSEKMNNPMLAEHVGGIGLYLLLMMASDVLEIMMITRNRYLMASSCFAISDLVRTALFILPVLWWPHIGALITGAVVFGVVRLTATLYFMQREFDGDLGFDEALLKNQLLYALPFAAAVSVEVIQTNLHQYAVFARYDPATFAIYAAGCLQVPIIELLAPSAANVMMVRMGEARAAGREQEVRDLWSDTTLKLALIFVPLVGLLGVLSHEIIVLLFTSAYAASAPIFLVWSMMVPAAALQVDSVLRVYANTRFILLMNLFRLFLLFTVLGPLMDLFGLRGAALAALLAVYGGKLFALARVKSLLGLSLLHLLPWGKLLALSLITGVASLSAILIGRTFELPLIPLLAAKGLGYAAVCLGLLLLAGLVTLPRWRVVEAWLARSLPWPAGASSPRNP